MGAGQGDSGRGGGGEGGGEGVRNKGRGGPLLGDDANQLLTQLLPLIPSLCSCCRGA